jgi:hypothetical protein
MQNKLRVRVNLILNSHTDLSRNSTRELVIRQNQAIEHCQIRYGPRYVSREIISAQVQRGKVSAVEELDRYVPR